MCCDLIVYDHLWNMHHIWQCEWGNAWFFRLEMICIFYKILGNQFYGIIALFASSKDVLSWFVIFGKLIEHVIDKKWFWKTWEPCEYIGYFKGFCETTWNWIVFWFHVNYELFMLLPLCCDIWLPSDYPARCRSLCDIGILATYLCGGLMSSWHNWCLRGIIDVLMA